MQARRPKKNYDHNTDMDQRRCTVVVARYQENLSWLTRFQRPDVDIMVYNKGPKHPLDYEGTIVPLPNVGRESHTYLTYVLEHYDHLPEIVHFTQGRVSDHPFHQKFEMIDLAPGAGQSANYAKCPWHTGLDHRGRLLAYAGQVLVSAGCDGQEWFTRYVDADPSIDLGSVFVYWNAIFSVRRERILSRPLRYYERLLRLVNSNANMEACHYFERSWYYIFNCHRPLIRSDKCSQ